MPGYTTSSLSVANGATLAVGVGGGGQWLTGNVENLKNNTAAFASGSTLGFNTDGGNFVYNSSAINNAGLGLKSMAPNTLTLSVANGYTGPTTINAGTLALGVNNALPTGSGKGNVAVNAGATLDLAGHNLTVNGLTDGSGGGGTVVNTTASMINLIVGNNNASSTYNGTILDSAGGRLSSTKVGTGTVIVNNGFSCPTPVIPVGPAHPFRLRRSHEVDRELLSGRYHGCGWPAPVQPNGSQVLGVQRRDRVGYRHSGRQGRR